MIEQVIDDKYRVLRRLGAGGMGSVFEAQHTGTGRRVAVKVMSEALAENDEMLRRFQREARALGAIETQHIVQVFDLGIERTSGHPYMAMELLSGMDLDAHIKRHGPLSPDLALRVVAQAAIGLQKAHEAGIVHRDIKPANIFLAERDAGEIVVKLLDFGIARIRRDNSTAAATGDLTQTGATIGSPPYMSPEQTKALPTLDHRSDVWSLGVVLYKALCGKTPHHVHTVLGSLILAICMEPAPPLQDLAPWVPPQIAAIAHRALQINPDDRFSSAQEMLVAIQQLLPGSWNLRKEMFVPLSDRDRLVSAPRLQPTISRASLPSTTAPPLANSAPMSASQSAGFSGSRAARMRSAVLLFAGGVTLAVSVVAVFVIRSGASENGSSPSGMSGSTPQADSATDTAIGQAVATASSWATTPTPMMDAGVEKPDASPGADSTAKTPTTKPLSVKPSATTKRDTVPMTIRTSM